MQFAQSPRTWNKSKLLFRTPSEMLQKFPNNYRAGSLLSAKWCSFPAGDARIYCNNLCPQCVDISPHNWSLCAALQLCFVSTHVVEPSLWSPNPSSVFKVPFSALFLFFRWAVLPLLSIIPNENSKNNSMISPLEIRLSKYMPNTSFCLSVSF